MPQYEAHDREPPRPRASVEVIAVNRRGPDGRDYLTLPTRYYSFVGGFLFWQWQQAIDGLMAKYSTAKN